MQLYTSAMIKKLFKKFSHPLRGILYAFLHDAGFQFQIVLGVIGLCVCLFFFRSLTQTEIFFLGCAYVLVLITELINSSIEMSLDKLHPELHDSIKRSKDIAAAAVLTAGIFLLFVIAVTIFL